MSPTTYGSKYCFSTCWRGVLALCPWLCVSIDHIIKASQANSHKPPTPKRRTSM